MVGRGGGGGGLQLECFVVVTLRTCVKILTGVAPESAASSSPISYRTIGRWLCLRFRFAFGDNEYMSHIGLLFRHARGTLVVGVMRKGQAAPRRHFFETWNQQRFTGPSGGYLGLLGTLGRR